MSDEDDRFYKELAKRDQAMADRWKKATGGKVAAKLTKNQLIDVVGQIFQSGKISARQADAINYFYTMTQGNWQRDTWDAFYIAVENAYTMDYFFDGSAVQLVKDTELVDVFDALGSSAGKIDFISPRTGLTYASDQYAGVKRLIKDGQIRVFEVDAAWMHAQSGLYRSDIDRLVLYKGPTPLMRKFMIVHEATHAIQDWMDVVSTHKFIEADAYVAQAAAALGVDQSTFDLVQEYPAQLQAAKLVLDRKAVPKNKDWAKVYAELVGQLSKSPTYIGTKDLPWKPAKQEKGKNEKKIFLDILQKMKSTPP